MWLDLARDMHVLMLYCFTDASRMISGCFTFLMYMHLSAARDAHVLRVDASALLMLY